MEKGNICLSFDDGRIDTYTKAFEIIKKYNLTATIHIATGYIDKTFPAINFNNIPSFSVENLKELDQYGIEITSHGDKHTTKIEDFIISYNKINGWLGNKYERIGFSIPNSECSQNEIQKIKNNKDVIYVRGGRNQQSYSFVGKVSYILYKITKLQVFYNAFNKHNINNNNKGVLFSVVIKNGDRAKTIIKYIKKYSKPNSTIIFMLHSVGEKPIDSPWTWDIKEFDLFCLKLSQLIKEERINVKTIKDSL